MDRPAGPKEAPNGMIFRSKRILPHFFIEFQPEMPVMTTKKLWNGIFQWKLEKRWSLRESGALSR